MSAALSMPSHATPGPSLKPALRRTAGILLFLLLAVGLWQAAIALFALPSFIMPTPATVGAQLVAGHGRILGALAYTLRTAALGLVLATAIALILAALFVQSKALTRAALPLVIGLRTAPVLAIAPILIMVFGRGLGTGVVVVVIVSFFPIMVNGMRGFMSTSRNTLELMHVYGAGPFQTFTKVRLPMAVPFIFTGLRSAASGAMLSAMLAEWLSGAPGLGTLILEASSYRNLGLLWATVLVSMATAFLIFTATSAADRRLSAWRQ